jgi:hypothetical protein
MLSPSTERTLQEQTMFFTEGCREYAALPTETLMRPRLLHNDTHCHLAYVCVTIMVTVIIRCYTR